MNDRSIYLASDMHFGAGGPALSLPRERHFVRWLDEIAHDARAIYLLGDVFDFWFEYKKAIPKGQVRLLGKLAELSDKGIDIHIFTGNHDLWLADYFPNELGIEVHTGPVLREWFGNRYFLAHGDGLGPGDHGYKAMKKVFLNPVSRWLFRWLHPDLGIGLARWASSLSNHHDYAVPANSPEVELLGEKEWLYQFAHQHLASHPGINFFVFGHRHALIDEQIGEQTRIILLGDWIQYHSFLKISPDGTELGVFPT